jgi:hypothetical protein
LAEFIYHTATMQRAIQSEWASANTTSLLNGDSVKSNQGANQLTGGAGADLFFARVESELVDFNALEDMWRVAL